MRAHPGKDAWGGGEGGGDAPFSTGADLRAFCPSPIQQMGVKRAPRRGSPSAAAGLVGRHPGSPPLPETRTTSRPFCSGFSGDHSSPLILDFNLSSSPGCLFVVLAIKMRFAGETSARSHVGNASPRAPCAHSCPKSRSVVVKLNLNPEKNLLK